jgi:hypothetical protein
MAISGEPHLPLHVVSPEKLEPDGLRAASEGRKLADQQRELHHV